MQPADNENFGEITRRLEAEERRITVGRVRFATAFMAVPLVLSFSFVDWFFAREQWLDFLFARLLVVPVAATAYASYYLEVIREKYWVLPAHLVSLFLGVFNAYLTYHSGMEVSLYYGGLNLVAIGGMFFLLISIRQLMILSACIYGPYFVSLAFSPGSLDFRYVIPNAALMVSTILLGFAAQYFNRKLRRSETEARHMLELDNRDKEVIIDRKAKEGVELEKLASQFSPQVIRAIKNREFDVTQRIRREVTCIFIDVENSTSRALLLDHSDYVSMLSEFFADTVQILLKHNVTVGTYLGDGLLAFTNAPQNSERHEAAAIEACLEVLESHRKKSRYYLEKWRGQFNIRIGMNTGYAHIGFFPDWKHGTYTALGGTVNLASRLCAQADKNSICVTRRQFKRISEFLPDVFAEVKSEESQLRGFEGEVFELYSVKPAKVLGETVETCPFCNSVLNPSKDFGSVLMMKCSSCEFSDPVRKAA